MRFDYRHHDRSGDRNRSRGRRKNRRRYWYWFCDGYRYCNYLFAAAQREHQRRPASHKTDKPERINNDERIPCRDRR